MAAATDELTLLERVFLRLGSAETDQQLQAALGKFLPPVLLKLSSTQDGVRKKVMELLVHINKRVKSRPQVQLPVEALLLQYQDPAASTFVINFTIIYIKLGYPRMEMKKQVDLMPGVLNAIPGKPVSHQDSLMLIIMPALGHINIPMDPEKRAAILSLQDKPSVAHLLLSFSLDLLLLPYGAVGQSDNQQSGQPIDLSQYPVPPGLSEYAFKRVIGDNPPTAEQLEQTKLGIVKFLVGGFFPDWEIFIHLVIAAADTRFSVANLAEMELKKMTPGLDWSSLDIAESLYSLFLGTDGWPEQGIPAELKRQPAGTRIRLKLLHYLCRVTKAGIIVPPCIQVVFNSLYGKNTNTRLKTLALQFASNIVQQCCLTPLAHVAGVILNGMIKQVSDGEEVHKPMAYTVIGQLGRRIPTLINKDLNLLQNLFDALVTASGDLRSSIRDALICVTPAFVITNTNESNIQLLYALISAHIESPEPSVRFVATHFAAVVFPRDHAPSRYLLLLACGDNKPEISTEAMNALYGSARKNEGKKDDDKQIFFPEFSKLVSFIHTKIQERMSGPSNKKVNVGNKLLPYNVATFSEIINYLRICLARSANVPVHNEPLENPCKYTPLIGRYLENLHKEHPQSLNNYLDMILLLGHASADQISLRAFLEVIGTIPHCSVDVYKTELPWIRTLQTSTKPDIRELAATIYARIVASFSTKDFEKELSQFLNATKEKNLESQHGALMSLSHMIERKLRQDENTDNNLNQEIFINAVNVICTFLDVTTPILLDAAVQAVGLLGRTSGLPIPAESETEWSKKKIVESLLSVIKNAKITSKIKENAILSLGHLCVGEDFPHTMAIIENLIGTAEETKDVSVHMSVGEALVCCVQGKASLEARDPWTVLPDEYKIPYSNRSNEFLKHVLNELFRISKSPHPNSRQATCVWMLALLKHNVDRECVKERFSDIHRTFIDFLAEDNDIVQSLAAKGLSLVHVNSRQEERDSLVSSILDQFMQGRRSVQQVTKDTKLFEEGQLGKNPSGGNISTYREICSLATELQKPDLVYYFMHLANHNALWTSKKGAAFGFAAIADVASDELNKYLPSIIPRLYRYQFDPTPKIQQSMASIWRAIVPCTTKAIEQYHKEILEDITENLTHNEWRVRISCCHALSDLLRANAPIRLAECAPELWRRLFRVMDDIHEDTRLTATNTTKVLSKICIRHCDASHGKAGEEVLRAILPVLLDIGIIHTVDTVRAVSLQTVSQLVSTAGALLKPSLVNLIPALLVTVGEIENPKLSYISNVYGGASDTQATIDNIRANAAKGHHAAGTITKCVQYIDADVLKDLMPKVIDLIKNSIGFGTKIACSNFLIHLSKHSNQQLQPYAGKILNALINSLLDRNIAVRKYNALAIGYVAGTAKESSLVKLFNTLKTWYMEKEDDSVRLAIGQALFSVATHNQEIARNYSNVIVPLVFFAMHAEKVPGNENIIEVWTDLWNDISPGTETAIRQHLETITSTLQSALESASWTTKVQAANAVTTMASKLGATIDENSRNILLNVLVNGLRGRTWEGKERLLNALATLTCNSKTAIAENNELKEVIVDTLYRESKKEAPAYRRHALEALCNVLHALNIDKFEEVYDIAQEILVKGPRKDDEDDDGDHTMTNSKRNEDKLKLQETVYEVLGKAWPSTNKTTQDKYATEFVTHCKKILPNSTRSIQIAILTTLNMFVDKLMLLKMSINEISEHDKEQLDLICGMLCGIIQHSIGATKQTRIKKEALNIVLSLSKKLQETQNFDQLGKLISVLNELLPDLTKDNQPEIRTRVIDIKRMLNI